MSEPLTDQANKEAQEAEDDYVERYIMENEYRGGRKKSKKGVKRSKIGGKRSKKGGKKSRRNKSRRFKK